MKLIRFFAALAGAIFLIGVQATDAAYNPGVSKTVDTVAQLQGIGAAAPFYPSVQVKGYNTASGRGGGLFVWNATSTATADSCNVIAATGVATGRYFRAGASPTIPLENCGAWGDAIVSRTGVANATTTFTDSGANCTAAAAAGLAHIVIIPKPGNTNAQVNTTFTCNSATSFNLAAGPSWSASNVTYAIGHDDGTAWTNALTLANAALSGNITLQSSAYLMTSLSTGMGTLSAGLNGQSGGVSTIILGGVSGSSNGITISYLGQANFSNVQIWCGDSGQDCGELINSVAVAKFSNFGFSYAARDCFVIDSGNGQGVENASFDTFQFQNCGRHGWNVNLSGTGYFNISKMFNGNIRGISDRQANGTCWNGAASGAKTLNLWIDTLECDAQYGAGGQSTYRPFSNAVYFTGAGWDINATNITVESTGGSSVCTGRCEAIGTNYAGSTQIYLNANQIFGGSNWATDTYAPNFNALGVLAINNGVTADLVSSITGGGLIGTLTVSGDDGAGSSTLEVYAVAGIGGTAQYSQIGSSAVVNSGVTFTVACAESGGITKCTVHNGNGAAATFSYQFVGSLPLLINTQ
jgi:hypothetical protein